MKWSIGFSYLTTDDEGRSFRANSTFQCEAGSIPEAYKEADKLSETLRGVKLGAIIPGWHNFAEMETKEDVKRVTK